MQEVLYIEDVAQAAVLLKPQRIEMLRLMDHPRTCLELGKIFGETPQKINYHIKALQDAGLVEQVGERRVRGTVEGSYQARARSYWLASDLVGQIGGAAIAQDQASLRHLLSLTEEMRGDIGHLAQQVGREIPSLGLSLHVELNDESRRADFMADVQQMAQILAHKYGATAGDDGDGDGDGDGDDGGAQPSRPRYRLVLACYPKS
ncbi:MAG TPA: helix-turn-helix domain-containing protein [Chloroflexia bacterium]|nr:helix-turn-helix domain-containing protein [Chloroflexia bacterium]